MKMQVSLVKGVAFLAAMVISAQAQSQAQPRSIIMGGRAVTLVADAVYAFPSARSRIVAVGGTDQGLGTFLQILDPDFPSKPALDRSASAEVYAAYKPDLAILKSSLRKGVGASLEALKIPVEYVDLETPEDYYRDLESLGRLFGDASRADELVGYYKGVVEKVARLTSREPKPRVLVLQSSAGSFKVPPSTWMQARIVQMAGGEPVWLGSNKGEGWAEVGFEQMAAWNPDVILVIDYRDAVDAVVGRMRADPRFALLKAGKSGTIKGFPQDFVSWDQPDTRWALGLVWVAKTLHPEALSNVSIEAEARGFYRFLYGFDDSTFDRVVTPRLKGDHGIR